MHRRLQQAPRLCAPEPLEERRLLTAVVDRHVFYNQSTFDGNDAGISAADDAAIATDKQALQPSVFFHPERLTDNATFDSNPRVYGDEIVWQGRGGTDAGTDEEIFYYNGSTVTQLTTNTDLDRNPEISALGIAWERGNSTTQEIIFHNRASEVRLTDNAVFDGNSSLSDERLSWERGSGTGLEIYTWASQNVLPLTNDALVDVQPHAKGNNTVWVSGSVPNRKVMYFDGNTTEIIGTSTFTIEDPKVDGQDVVWESFKQSGNTQREIYYYNGNIVQRLTTNDYGDFDPQVSGGRVVWWGGTFNNFHVWMFDGVTTTQLSSGIRNQFPQIDGQYVVWQGYDGHDDEIFFWDGQQVIQVTDNDVDDTSPQISGNHIVWQAAEPFNGNSQEIYHAYYAADPAGPENVTSYTRGINGIMIDVTDLPAEAVLTAADFTFRMGANNAPEAWGDAPAPTAISVRPGAGEGGSDRITITWNAGSIKNVWLEVTLKGNDARGDFNTNTGLEKSDRFYFGNRVGDTFVGSPAGALLTNALDEIGARQNIGFNAGVENIYDFDRNGLVNASDQITSRTNVGFLNRLDLTVIPEPAPLAAAPPAAAPASVALADASPDAAPAEAGIASALAAAAVRVEGAESRAAKVLRVATDRALDHHRIVRYFESLRSFDPPARRTGLAGDESFAADLADDELLAPLLRR